MVLKKVLGRKSGCLAEVGTSSEGLFKGVSL